MNDADETPEWWDEVIHLPLTSKSDARRIIKLCLEGKRNRIWKEENSHYLTSEGRILFTDYDRAQSILLGASKPDPGRPGQHDWKLIKTLVLEVAAKMPKPTNKTALRRTVRAPP